MQESNIETKKFTSGGTQQGKTHAGEQLEKATMDLQVRVHKILVDAQRQGTDFNKYPKLALFIVKKELPKRIQNHRIMSQINMQQLIIFVLHKMGISLSKANEIKLHPKQEEALKNIKVREHTILGTGEGLK